MIKVNARAIQTFLESEDMPCVQEPKSKEWPFEQLFVPMGVDEQGRDLLLHIKILEEDLSENSESLSLKKESLHFHNIQFHLALPFQIKDDCVGDIARLILLLNRSFGIPGLEMSELDRIVYFRSAILAGQEIEEAILLSVIGNIVIQMDVFSSSLETVGTGKQTFVEMMNEVLSPAPAKDKD